MARLSRTHWYINTSVFHQVTVLRWSDSRQLQVKPDAEDGAYDWAKQWYPLAFVEDLDPKVPHAMELLGQRLVLWRDAEQQWRCFQDKCPHRLAPLSGTYGLSSHASPALMFCAGKGLLAFSPGFYLVLKTSETVQAM